MGLFRRTPELRDLDRKAVVADPTSRKVRRWPSVVFSDRVLIGLILAVVVLAEWRLGFAPTSQRSTSAVVTIIIALSAVLVLTPRWRRLRRRVAGEPEPARQQLTPDEMEAMRRKFEDAPPDRSWHIGGSFGAGSSGAQFESHKVGADGTPTEATYSGSFGGMLWWLVKRLFGAKG